ADVDLPVAAVDCAVCRKCRNAQAGHLFVDLPESDLAQLLLFRIELVDAAIVEDEHRVDVPLIEQRLGERDGGRVPVDVLVGQARGADQRSRGVAALELFQAQMRAFRFHVRQIPTSSTCKSLVTPMSRPVRSFAAPAASGTVKPLILSEPICWATKPKE